MQKILLAMNARTPGNKALEFACFLAKLTRSKITGTILENEGDTMMVLAENKRDAVDEKAIRNTIQWFEQKCITEEAKHDFHTDQGMPLSELIAESRFADIIVIDPETSFSGSTESVPTKFVKDFLHYSECPVVVAPQQFEGIDEIVLAYDGSASSAFAIRQFSYLFPQLSNRKLTILNVSSDGQVKGKQKHQFTCWLKEHYTNFHFVELPGEPGTALFDFLLRKENIFFVIGAYGRNMISQIFQRSRAELVIKAIPLATFIAHR